MPSLSLPATPFYAVKGFCVGQRAPFVDVEPTRPEYVGKARHRQVSLRFIWRPWQCEGKQLKILLEVTRPVQVQQRQHWRRPVSSHWPDLRVEMEEYLCRAGRVLQPAPRRFGQGRGERPLRVDRRLALGAIQEWAERAACLRVTRPIGWALGSERHAWSSNQRCHSWTAL